jgi:long-subunit fatty acid transport protein
MSRFAGALVVCTVATWPATVEAGGYDLPTTCCARHVGLGGAAVAHVSDASALLYNPAGMTRVERASVFGGASLMLGHIDAAPERGVQSRSDLAVAPLFLVAGSVRITDWLVGGLAVYPVAAAGAQFQYESLLGATEDRTSAIFLEGSLGLAAELPSDVSVGLGYRATALRMARFKKGADAASPGLDLTLSGASFASFRAGIQWRPVSEPPNAAPSDRRRLQLGLTYRHRTHVGVSADDGIALGRPVRSVESSLILPTKLSVGARGDLGRFGAVLDFDYTLNSQNRDATLQAELDGSPTAIPNVFGWRDSMTIHGGVEYRLLGAGELPLRLGFAFDDTTASRAYPTPFGPPPAPTYMVTAGAGYDVGRWQVNVAYGFRFGSTRIDEGDLAGAGSCAFCGDAGTYRLRMHSISTDFSHDFD